MASAARRARGPARRPFAVLSSPSPGRKGSAAFASAENIVVVGPEDGVLPLAHPVRRFGKCVRARSSTPVSVSKKPVAAAAIRRRMSSSFSTRFSTPAAKARDPPLRNLAKDARDGKTAADASRLSSPSLDEADHGRQERPGGASRKEALARMEEAMASLPEPGEGRVKYLVDTFERFLSLAAGGGPETRSGGGATRRRRRTTMSEATPTAPRTSSSASSSQTPPLLLPPAAEVIDVSYPSSEVSFPAIAGVACILDASDRTTMIRAAREQRRQKKRCDSTGSAQRTSSSRKVITSVTSQRPFNLRTAQRGKAKEENFVQRIRKMQLEEEMMRNPLAQYLPFTTDEPEYPAKPPIKEPTEPANVVLHSDVRAVGRAKFDHQIAERTSFMEEVKLAKARQQKMDEEIEIKQLRKEQVPKAHPMPDFTKPFMPKRSLKPRTIPREPRFHTRLMRNTAKA